MAVLIIREAHGLSMASYLDVFRAMQRPLQGAHGFVMHVAHVENGGMRVMEIWRNKDEAEQFAAEHIELQLNGCVTVQIVDLTAFLAGDEAMAIYAVSNVITRQHATVARCGQDRLGTRSS